MNDVLHQATKLIMTKRGEFINDLLKKSYKGWQLKIFEKHKWVARLVNLKILINPLDRKANELIKEEITIMQGEKEKAKATFSCAHKNPPGEVTQIRTEFTQIGKQQGIHISNVDRGIVISNTDKGVALAQAARNYNRTVNQLFPIIIELKCSCKFYIHTAKQFPDKSEKCEHGLYFVQYLGGIRQ